MNKLRLVLLLSLCVLEAKFSYAQTDKLDSLFNIGMNLLQSGKYDEAARIYEECLTFPEVRSTKTEAVLSAQVAACKLALGDFAVAADMYGQAIQVFSNVVDSNNDDDINYLNEIVFQRVISLAALADNYFQQDNYKTAVDIMAIAWEGCEFIEEGNEEKQNIIKSVAIDYAKYLTGLAISTYSSENSLESISLLKKSIRLLDRANSNDRVLYLMNLKTLATYLSLSNKYNEAISCRKQLLNIYEKLPELDRLDYASSLHDLALDCCQIGNYSDALKIEKESLHIYKEKQGTDSVGYIKSLLQLSVCYGELEQYQKAISLADEGMKICNRVYGVYSNEYNNFLGLHITYLQEQGNILGAKKLMEESLKITSHLYGENSINYAFCLNDYAEELCFLGFYNEALDKSKRALEIIEFQLRSSENIYYALTLSSIAKIQMYKGNYTEALRCYEQRKNILRNIREGNVIIADSISNSELWEFLQDKIYKKETNGVGCTIQLNDEANLISCLGNYQEAISIYNQALQICERNGGDNNRIKAMLLSNIAINYFKQGDCSKAINYCKQSLEIYKAQKNKSLYARNLNSLAGFFMESGDYEEAGKMCRQTLYYIDRDFDKFSSDYAVALSTLAEWHTHNGDYFEASKLNKQAISILESIGSGKSDEYVEILTSLTDCVFKKNNTTEVTFYTSYISDILINKIFSTFEELSSIERGNFWNKYNKWFTEVQNRYVYSCPTEKLCMTAYNGALLSKGLLLNTEIEMRKLLQESGDAVVDSLYEEMRMNKVMLQRLYEKPKNERFLSTDSIEKIVDGLEKQLLKRSKVYGDYTKNLRIDYKDVREKLKDGDLAIEFCSFPLSKDSTMYMALVLRNDMEYPKMIPLFEEKQISKLRKDIYKGGYTATLVWKPLEQYLNKAKNVYFGPSGELYNIAIENIPHWSENGLMSDKWNIYRLSSTRELAVIRDKDAVRKATVYGGIVYDTGTDVLTADTLRYGRQRSVFYGLYNLSDSLSVRGGVEYLPATKDEAEYVDDALKGRHIASTLRTDMQATEGAFKDMTGKRNNLLHIATHAFYWPEKEVATADRDFMFMSNMPQRYKEDKAMTRSGLILAGANNALRGMKLPGDVNDGILTAKEIAQLDLRGLDLVVLSACQTGLGEVTGDGVFGLQRGFKKAGANSLMMTLWSVDDEATSLFMKEFYRQLMAGNGKHKSMKAAQRHVREYKETDEDGEVTHPYENYRYWAAFVLLDAIH